MADERYDYLIIANNYQLSNSLLISQAPFAKTPDGGGKFSLFEMKKIERKISLALGDLISAIGRSSH